MSISSFCISTLLPSSSSSSHKLRSVAVRPQGPPSLVVECSSRPQKKATKHHMKTRPKKSQPWDIRRRPTVYAPLPSLPPDWTLLDSDAQDAGPAVVASSEVEK